MGASEKAAATWHPATAATDQSACIHCGDRFPNAMLRDIHEHECDERETT